MNSVYSGSRFLLLLLTLQSSQAGKVRVTVGAEAWPETEKEVFISNVPTSIRVTHGQIIVSLHKHLESHGESQVTENTWNSFTKHGSLAQFIIVDMFADATKASYKLGLAGKFAIGRVQASQTEPYHIDVQVNMNRGQLMRMRGGAQKYDISARKGPLIDAEEILYIGTIDVVLEEEYKLKRDSMERIVKITKTTKLFLESANDYPMYTLISIKNTN